jgi:hypothetical protein
LEQPDCGARDFAKAAMVVACEQPMQPPLKVAAVRGVVRVRTEWRSVLLLALQELVYRLADQP